MTIKKTETVNESLSGQNTVLSAANGTASLGDTVPAPDATPGTNGSGGEGGEKKKKKRSITFARELYFIEAALLNSLNEPLIRQYVLEYGYTEERLNTGKEKAENARTKYEAQQKAIAAQRECSRLLKEKRSEADKVYRDFVRVIRLGFENQETVINTLGIDSQRKRGFGEWVAKTQIFYNNIYVIPGVLEFMSKLDYTREKVEEGQQLYENVKTARNDLKNAVGETQRATEQKAVAFRQLKHWWSAYKKILDIALEQDPQLKEKLGIATPMVA